MTNLSGSVNDLLNFKAMQKTLYQQDSTLVQHTAVQRNVALSKPAPLSERELQVLRLVAEGYSNPEIATILYLSLSTIKSHIRNIMTKLQMEHRIQIAVFAVRNQLV